MPKVTPVEERWARGWVRGISRLLALGPPEERPEEYKKEIEAIEKIALEPGSEVYKKARKWRKRLLEIIAEKR